MVRMEPTADDSLAAMRARSKFGIAIAAMIRMIATTISSSLSEKPFCLRICNFPFPSPVEVVDPPFKRSRILRSKSVSTVGGTCPSVERKQSSCIFREKGELDDGCDLISGVECKKSLTLIVVLPRIGNRRLDKGK